MNENSIAWSYAKTFRAVPPLSLPTMLHDSSPAKRSTSTAATTSSTRLNTDTTARRQTWEQAMSTDPNDLLPSAKDCMKKIAEAEAEKASQYMRRQAAAEAEKQALVERFEKASGVSDEERLKRAAAIIQRAVNNGMTEVQVSASPIRSAPIKDAPSIKWSDGASKGAFSVLGYASAPPRVPPALSDRRVAERNARRRRHDAGLAITI
jgi:hypothetical protein